jgi:uncharacterized membrane protein YphA (DoxX/SURF4 family)
MSGRRTIVRPDHPQRGAATAAAVEYERRTLQRVTTLIARLGLAYLFFTQLLWKMPPSFGCPADFRVTTVNPAGFSAENPYSEPRSSGLCDWIGIESVWANQPRTLFQANIDNKGGAESGLPIGWVARANGALIDSVIAPNIRWFGWLIWGGEALIVVTMLLGLFSRLGGIVAVAISAQLVIGLAGITNPYEWEWAYTAIFLLSLVLIGIAPGRFLGLDTLLRPRLRAAAARGNGLARFALALT